MGGGSYSDHTYHTARATRKASNIDDFDYSKHNSTIHASLDPRRIATKPFHALESRDNAEHPESTPVVVTFDVTGSNIDNARVVQQQLPKLMALVGKYLRDPQICIAANDDIQSVGANAVQISEFESDNRIDESIRNLLLTGQGGANDHESYELLLWGLAHNVIFDSLLKRGRKGYLFVYADEPMPETVHRADIHTIYGTRLEADLPLADVIQELHRIYHVFVMWPANSTYHHSRTQYQRLFGKERVLTLQSPESICELVGAVIGACERRSKAEILSDLKQLGSSSADSIVNQLALTA